MNKKYWYLIAAVIVALGLLFVLKLPYEEPRQAFNPTNRAEWKQALNWSDNCVDEINPDYSGISEFKIDHDESLVLVDCFQAAYQTNYRLYFYNSFLSEAGELPLQYINSAGEIDTNANGFAGIVDNKFADTGELSLLSKAVGHGGCGYQADYKWDSSLASFRIVSQKANFDCDNAITPDEWPKIDLNQPTE